MLCSLPRVVGLVLVPPLSHLLCQAKLTQDVLGDHPPCSSFEPLYALHNVSKVGRSCLEYYLSPPFCLVRAVEEDVFYVLFLGSIQACQYIVLQDFPPKEVVSQANMACSYKCSYRALCSSKSLVERVGGLSIQLGFLHRVVFLALVPLGPLCLGVCLLLLLLIVQLVTFCSK